MAAGREDFAGWYGRHPLPLAHGINPSLDTYDGGGAGEEKRDTGPHWQLGRQGRDEIHRVSLASSSTTASLSPRRWSSRPASQERAECER